MEKEKGGNAVIHEPLRVQTKAKRNWRTFPIGRLFMAASTLCSIYGIYLHVFTTRHRATKVCTLYSAAYPAEAYTLTVIKSARRRDQVGELWRWL